MQSTYGCVSDRRWSERFCRPQTTCEGVRRRSVRFSSCESSSENSVEFRPPIRFGPWSIGPRNRVHSWALESAAILTEIIKHRKATSNHRHGPSHRGRAYGGGNLQPMVTTARAVASSVVFFGSQACGCGLSVRNNAPAIEFSDSLPRGNSLE